MKGLSRAKETRSPQGSKPEPIGLEDTAEAEVSLKLKLLTRSSTCCSACGCIVEDAVVSNSCPSVYFPAQNSFSVPSISLAFSGSAARPVGWPTLLRVASYLHRLGLDVQPWFELLAAVGMHALSPSHRCLDPGRYSCLWLTRCLNGESAL